jgi:hypothetical protein
MSSVVQVRGVRPDVAGVDGMISLAVWAIILVALVQRRPVKGQAGKAALVLLGIFGVALFFGDGTVPAGAQVQRVLGDWRQQRPDSAGEDDEQAARAKITRSTGRAGRMPGRDHR